MLWSKIGFFFLVSRWNDLNNERFEFGFIFISKKDRNDYINEFSILSSKYLTWENKVNNSYEVFLCFNLKFKIDVKKKFVFTF